MTYFKIKNATKEKAELYIYGDIVGSEWEKWTDSDTCPQDITSALKEHEGKDLDIYVNSGGGSVFAGLAIYNQLKRFTGFKTVYVDGLAASIASVIALAGDKVIMPTNAFMMIHKPWTIGMGNSNDLRKTADDLDRIEQGILNVYEDNLKDGADMKQVKKLVDAETWLTGKQAAEIFNIEIGAENKAAACASDYFDRYINTPKELKPQAKVEPENKQQPNGDDLKNEIEIMKMKLQLL